MDGDGRKEWDIACSVESNFKGRKGFFFFEFRRKRVILLFFIIIKIITWIRLS